VKPVARGWNVHTTFNNTLYTLATKLLLISKFSIFHNND
jgi:hypothetical protein